MEGREGGACEEKWKKFSDGGEGGIKDKAEKAGKKCALHFEENKLECRIRDDHRKRTLISECIFYYFKTLYRMSVTDDNACLLVAARLQKSLRKELNIVGTP